MSGLRAITRSKSRATSLQPQARQKTRQGRSKKGRQAVVSDDDSESDEAGGLGKLTKEQLVARLLEAQKLSQVEQDFGESAYLCGDGIF